MKAKEIVWVVWSTAHGHLLSVHPSRDLAREYARFCGKPYKVAKYMYVPQAWS